LNEPEGSTFCDPGTYVQENNCANDRRDEGSNENSAGQPNEAEDEAANNSSNHTYNNISYDSEFSAAGDMTAAKPVIMPTISQPMNPQIHEDTQKVVGSLIFYKIFHNH
jgi:hypothetical protein